jgi:hypothetical protein
LWGVSGEEVVWAATYRRCSSGAPSERLQALREYLGLAGRGHNGRARTRGVNAVRTVFYCTAFIMSKIGKYIATTIPPTSTPRTTIMTGSINESSEETATSTSSS